MGVRTVAQHNENEQYDYCCEDHCDRCEDHCCKVYKWLAEIDRDGKLMKEFAITIYTSFAISLIILFIFNYINAWLTSFTSCIAVAIAIKLLNNEKLAIIAVPSYVALAVAIHHAMVLFPGLEKPLHVQVTEILGLIGGIALSTSMIKTVFLDNSKLRESRVQAL